MNWARLFGHLGRCYRNHKAVRIGLNRPAGVISWFGTLMLNFFGRFRLLVNPICACLGHFSMTVIAKERCERQLVSDPLQLKKS